MLKEISNGKNVSRILELSPHEMRQHQAFEEFLDLGADIDTALKYTQRRLGPIQPHLYRWLSQ